MTQDLKTFIIPSLPSIPSDHSSSQTAVCVCMRLCVNRSSATQIEILTPPLIFLLAFRRIINDRNCHLKITFDIYK